MKSWLQNNEGKSVAEKFIRTLKNKFDKYMASVPKSLYIYNDSAY